MKVIRGLGIVALIIAAVALIIIGIPVVNFFVLFALEWMTNGQ